MKDDSDIERLLSEHPLFRSVDGGHRRRLLLRASRVYLEPSERLYTSGQPASEVFALLSGAIQIEYPKPPAQRGFVATMIPAPGFLGECQVLHGRSWSGTGVALFPTIAIGFRRALLEELILEFPAVALALYRELSWRFLGAIDTWKYQQGAPPSECLARYLLSYVVAARRANVAEPEVVSVRQSDLASATALRRETINRHLREWERAGWLRLRTNGIELVDVAALESVLPEGERRLLVRDEVGTTSLPVPHPDDDVLRASVAEQLVS